jgi:hypothetical protein
MMKSASASTWLWDGVKYVDAEAILTFNEAMEDETLVKPLQGQLNEVAASLGAFFTP